MKTQVHVFLSCLVVVFFTFASKARAVPVEYLQPISLQSLIFDDTIDKVTLEQALEEWRVHANDMLAQFEAVEAEQADHMVISKESPINTMYNEFGGNVAMIVEPMLSRMEKVWEVEKLSSEDRKIIDLLARYGLELIFPDGAPTLIPNKSFFHKRISLSEDGQAYLAILDSQPEYCYVENDILFSMWEVSEWAIQWEQYFKTNPTPHFAEAARQRYRILIDFILYGDLSRARSFDDNGRINEDWMDDLDNLVETYSGTETAAIVSKFLAAVKANDRKLSLENKKQTSIRLASVFQSEAQKGTVKAAEEKLLGKHKFSLEWVSWDWEYMGQAMITRQGDKLYIDAKQEHEGNYITLQGEVTVIDDLTFIVTGELVTRVDHIFEGQPCVRTDSFEFRVREGRKYWRLQKRENPCDYYKNDYIDVYF